MEAVAVMPACSGRCGATEGLAGAEGGRDEDPAAAAHMACGVVAMAPGSVLGTPLRGPGS